MPVFEIKFKRIEEGTYRVEADEEALAIRILDVELSCGTAPLEHVENTILSIVPCGKEDVTNA